LGIGDWGLGPIPNPQSPIPILSILIKNYNIVTITNILINILNLIFYIK